MKRALITGITGQDGSCLAELPIHRIDHLYLDEHEHKGCLHMHFGELADASRLTNLSVRLSGVKSRFYQASSSEMFGAAPPPQNELTRFHPRSPYAVAKGRPHQGREPQWYNKKLG